MSTTDQANTIFTLAADLVQNTSQNIFLTGKAGTGKTTFLKYIKEHSIKNTVVVAPTGVAAINAGGVTMHSFFQLPFGPYIPQSYSSNKFSLGTSNVADKHTLFKNIRFDNKKRKLINELQLLIIDEISMVRADTLDAVDAILRHFRRSPELPFGGVQVLFIGDMYQLPPVIKDDEWQLLSEYYESHFFFHAKVTLSTPPLYIELKKIYRQTDQQFIDILNRVRNNIPTTDDLDILNDAYNPNATLNNSDTKSILLTTHNYKADNINQQELYKLNTASYTYKGVIEGEYGDKLLPNDMELTLKEGAQIMLIKNDSSAEKKYYNGKLATVKELTADNITVLFEYDTTPYTLKKETWKNVRYKLTDSNEIDEDELGSYTQYPIRLAWAVTIHKSQGLTFSHVVIDAGNSFAAGQVYVALSRCTSLAGITLHSRIERTAINTDERIVAFAKQETKAEELVRVLDLEKEAYLQQQLIQAFSFSKLLYTTYQYTTVVQAKKLPNAKEILELAHSMYTKAKQLSEVAGKFTKELHNLFNQNHTTEATIADRATKAIHYFSTHIAQYILSPLQQHIASLAQASKVKQYLVVAKGVEQDLWLIIIKLNQASYNSNMYITDTAYLQPYNPANQAPSAVTKEAAIPTATQSYNLYLAGNNTEQIALIRNMVTSTIEGHLAKYVRSGHIPIHELVAADKVAAITNAMHTLGRTPFKPIMDYIGTSITYADVRAVANYLEWQEEQASTQQA